MKGSGLAPRTSAGFSLGCLGGGLGRLGLILCGLGIILCGLGIVFRRLGLRIRVSLGLYLRFSRGPLYRIAWLRQVLSLDLRLFDRAASRLDRGTRTLRSADAFQRHSLLDLA